MSEEGGEGKGDHVPFVVDCLVGDVHIAETEGSLLGGEVLVVWQAE